MNKTVSSKTNGNNDKGSRKYLAGCLWITGLACVPECVWLRVLGSEVFSRDVVGV